MTTKQDPHVGLNSGLANENEATALLELVDISVHYGAVVALDKVSLRIRRGELVAVMGPNGAGKSTVLKAIMGLAPVWWVGLSTCARRHCLRRPTKF